MNMQPMKLNNIQTGFKRILLTVATVFMLGNGWAQDAKVLKGRIVNAAVSYTHLTLPTIRLV